MLNDLIIKSQINSLLLSLLMVFLITSILFRSVLTGFLAVLPLSVTVAVNFGVMGIFNIPLDIGTVMISSISIGIGIDYAVHYLSRYKTEIAGGAEVKDAIIATNTTTGRAIVFNALAVGFGFLVLTFSSISSLGAVGRIIALTMLVSSIGSLTLLPSLLSVVDRTWMGKLLHKGALEGIKEVKKIQ